MSEPRIALVSLSTLAVGGIETHILQLLRGLRGEARFCVIGELTEPFLSAAATLDAECVPLSSAGKMDGTAWLSLRSEFRRRNIRIVHTHDTRGGLLGRLAGKAAGCRTIHTIHTPSFFLPESRLAIWAYKQAERFLNHAASDRVIFVSGAIRDLYRREGMVAEANSVWIANGLEEDWRTEPPKRHSASARMRMLYVGRLAPEKGIRNLAAAFGIAVATLEGIELHVAGDGPERKSLEAAADAGGWTDRLRMLGSIPRAQVREQMGEADLFVLPSRFESMSYTLLEAMAMGLACIATDVGGNRDLVEPGRTGLLIPAENPAALASAMIELAGSPVRRREMGEAGRRKALGYTLAEMVSKTRVVYQSLAD